MAKLCFLWSLLVVFVDAQYSPSGSGSCPLLPSGPFAARAVLSGNSTVTGIVHANQTEAGAPTQITGQLTGLAPNTLHGFHVHQFGDLSNGCTSAGEHYNPANMTHGDVNVSVNHNGDLGNLMSDGNGTVIINRVSDKIQLTGLNSVIGRTLIVHALVDDLGQGGNAASLANGNSGARLACGILGNLKL